MKQLKTQKKDPLDVYLNELELDSVDETKTRWGMSDEEVERLTVKDQRSTPMCMGYTASSMMEKMYGDVFSALYPYVNTDRLFEGGNMGGIQPRNMFLFLKNFGSIAEKDAPDNPPLSTSGFAEYYNSTVGVINEFNKSKIKSFVKVNSTIDDIKTALENFDVVNLNITKYRKSRGTYFGEKIDRFKYSKSGTSGHAMMLTHIKLIDGKHVAYLWNSWGRGKACVVLEEFPPEAVFIYAGTKDEEITKQVTTVIEQKKVELPSYTYFTDKEVVGLKHELVEMLDNARGIAGIPFIINSGYRSKEKNEQVGGVDDSAHLYGLAVDLKCTTSTNRAKMIKALQEVGFTRIGIGKTFIHADIDTSKVQNVYWLY